MVILFNSYSFTNEMNNTFKKYLFVINLLLLTGFTNLYANSCIETVSIHEARSTSKDSENITPPSLNHVLDIASQPNRDKKTFSEFIDSETFEENDEQHSDINFTPYYFNCPIAAISYARLLDDLNCKLQESIQHYIFNYSKTVIPLHTKFQVFII